MFRGAPCADYPDYLVICAVAIGVSNHQQRHAIDHAKRLPALLVIGDSLGDDEVQRIVPDFLCERERDAVLDDVCCRLALVLFELH